jgi:hypothetical protein
MDGTCRSLGRECTGRGVRHQHVGLRPNQLDRQFGQTRIVPLGPPELDDDILAFDVAEIPKPCAERFDLAGVAGRRGGAEEPDPVHLTRRLRLGGEGRGEQHHPGQELAAVHHSMT